jgi:hypothetical protein
MKSWKFKLGVVAIFALGAVVGAVATGLYFRYGVSRFELSRPDQAVSHVMRRMNRELGLNDEQRQAIEPIVLDGIMKMRALRARLSPEVETLVAETSGRVKKHLNPDQQRRLDEHYAEVLRRWRVYAGPGPVPSGSPGAGAAATGPAPAATGTAPAAPPGRPQGK